MIIAALTDVVLPKHNLIVSNKKLNFLGNINSQDLFIKSSEKTNYRETLAKSLSKELNKTVSAKDLNSVMTKEEMLDTLSKLTEQNYVASEENIKNGVFLADLHSHSLYSDGKASVQTILDEAAAYGNKLKSLNGKNFIFALTDHDGVEGVKEALKIISQNPDKYKNIKFIPAAELSFMVPCEDGSDRYKLYHNHSEYPEVLIYGINPFSETTKKFFNEVYSKRIKKIEDITGILNETFAEHPFSKTSFDNLKSAPWAYTQNYALINRLNEMNNSFTQKIDNIYYKFIFPKFDNIAKINSKYEKNFNDIVKYSKNENAFLALAHPAYTIQNFKKENQLKNMQYLINSSEGMLKFAENYHQAYIIGRDIASKSKLDEYNQVLAKLNLINIGGRDNHKEKLFQ